MIVDGVIRSLIEVASRLKGVRLTHVIHPGGDRFDFEAVIEGDAAARCFGANLPTRMPSGNEPGVSGRLDRVAGTVEWTFDGSGKSGSEDVTTLGDVIRVLQTWRGEALARQGGLAVRRLLTVAPEFGEIVQTLASISPLGPTTAEAARLDAQLVALHARMEARLKANAKDPTRLEAELATLAIGLRETRAISSGRHGIEGLARTLLQRVAVWIKTANAQ